MGQTFLNKVHDYCENKLVNVCEKSVICIDFTPLL